MGYDKDKFDKKPFRDEGDEKKSWRRDGFDKRTEDKPKHITRTKSTKTDMFEEFAEFLFGENNERAADKYFNKDGNKKVEPRKVEFDKDKPRRERPGSNRSRPKASVDNIEQEDKSEIGDSSESSPILPWQKGRKFGSDRSEDKDRFEKKEKWSPNQDDRDERNDQSDSNQNENRSSSNDDNQSLPWGKKPFEKKSFEKKPFEKKSFGRSKDEDRKPFEKKDSWSPNRGANDEVRDRPRFDKSEQPVRNEDKDALPWKKPPRKRVEAKPFEKEPLDVPNITRLNKYVAKTGLCSRRKAAELVKAGEIKVNGEVHLNPAYEMQEGDVVEYNGSVLIKEDKLVYLLLNKPKGYITTVDDENDRKTVMDLVQNKIDVRAYPVGRLDRNTTGLLLITNDGDLAKKLSHPSHKVQKFYHVVLDKVVTEEHLQEIKDGLTLEDGPVEVDAVDYISGKLGNEVGVEIHLGRNRIVRRIFEHLGYTVERLDRSYYAGLTKKDLSRGWSRELTKKEIIMLKHFTGS
jgi:23S rRNA pseudouridine2605 synthase